MKTRRSHEELKSGAARRYNGTKPEDWWNPRPAMADLPPSEWSGNAIDDAIAHTSKMLAAIGPETWTNVHAYVIELISEGP